MKKRWLHLALALLLVLGVVTNGFTLLAPIEEVEAAADFELKAAVSMWDEKSKRSNVRLEWDPVEGVNDSGYSVYQNEVGSTVDARPISTSYNRQIKVLNIYPAGYNNLKSWMENKTDVESNPNSNKNGIGFFVQEGDLVANEDPSKIGQPYIQVDEVEIGAYNANPDLYLKEDGNYKYDVLMFGSADANRFKDLQDESYKATEMFAATGRGILFGHDTVFCNNPIMLGFASSLGLESETNRNGAGQYLQGSRKVMLVNDGYLMKYPFQMERNQILTVPLAHNYNLSIKDQGTIWMDFIPDPDYDNRYDNQWQQFKLNGTGSAEEKKELKDKGYKGTDYISGWYLKTINNLAMIQTGHSEGASTPDERKIIANVLFDLAQVTTNTQAYDYSVEDKAAPTLPDLSTPRFNPVTQEFTTIFTSNDVGSIYEWKVKAGVKGSTIPKESNKVETEVASDIHSYVYYVDENEHAGVVVKRPTPGKDGEFTYVKNGSAEGSLVVEFDKNGILTENTANSGGYSQSKNQISKVTAQQNTGQNQASTTDARPEEVTGIKLDPKVEPGEKQYLHVVAVDRAGNISAVKDWELKANELDYVVERNGDVATLEDITLEGKALKNKNTLEITVPENVEIKNAATDLKAAATPAEDAVDQAEENALDAENQTETEDDADAESEAEENETDAEKQTDSERELLRSSGDLALPQGWKQLGKYKFTIGLNQDKEVIQKFLESLKFTIKDPKDEPGEIMVTLTNEPETDALPQDEPADQEEKDKEKSKEETQTTDTQEKNQTSDTKEATQTSDTQKASQTEETTATTGSQEKTEDTSGSHPDAQVKPALEPITDDKPAENPELKLEPTPDLDPEEEPEEEEQPLKDEPPVKPLTWTSAIPQKIRIRVVDDRGEEVGDVILLDQKLRIGQKVRIPDDTVISDSIPPTLSLLGLKLVEGSDALAATSAAAIKAYDFGVKADAQSVRIVYGYKQDPNPGGNPNPDPSGNDPIHLTLHVRQIAIDNSVVAIPKAGYATVFGLKQNVRDFTAGMTMNSGAKLDEVSYTDYLLKDYTPSRYYSLAATIPEYYQLTGYGVAETAEDAEKITVDSATKDFKYDVWDAENGKMKENPELWVTIFIKPTTDNPAFYSWDELD